MTSVHRAFRENPNYEVINAFDNLYGNKRTAEKLQEAQDQLAQKARTIVEVGTWREEATVSGGLGLRNYGFTLKGTQFIALDFRPYFLTLREQPEDDRTTRKNIHLMIQEADSRSDIEPGSEIQPETIAVFSSDGTIELDGVEHPTLEMIEDVSRILSYIEGDPHI